MPGSRPEVGSSRKISNSLVSSSRATETRLRWPPESEVIFLSLWMSSLSSARTSVIRDWRSASVVSAGKRSLAAYLRALATVSSLCRMSSCGTRPMRWRSSANCLYRFRLS
ncbi:hypothetical protein SBADM41S_00559 [Streptomyces badius]